MFFETFFQIIRAREFIIILLIMLVFFPIIFAVASRTRKSTSVKKIPKSSGVTEKKSLKRVPEALQTT